MRSHTEHVARVRRKPLDTDNWPGVCKNSLTDDARRRFERLERAMSLLKGGSSFAEAAVLAKVGTRRFRRLVDRCSSLHEDGRVAGWRGLAAHARVKETVRREPLAANKRGRAGAFQLLMRQYPTIGEELRKFANNKGIYARTPNVKQWKTIEGEYVRLVGDCGISPNAYPLDTKNRGKKALRRWWKRSLALKDGVAAIKALYGEEAARHVEACSAVGGQLPLSAERYLPYGEWQLDETDVGVYSIYELPNQWGDWDLLELPRFKQLRIVDVGTGANLATRPVFGTAATLSDLLLLLHDAVAGTGPMKLTLPGLAYEIGAGYPAALIEALRFAVPRVLHLDNALIHLANALRSVVVRLWGGEVLLGKPYSPEPRGSIEARFSAQVRNIVRHIPGTAGSGPADRKRRSGRSLPPIRVNAVHVTEVLDVHAQNENARPARASGYVPSLVRLTKALETQSLKPLYMPEMHRHRHLFCAPKRATIKADFENRRGPYVLYLGVRYRGSWLETRLELVNRSVDAYVDLNDLRKICIYCDGTEIGWLRAEGQWGVLPHDHRIRSLFLRLRKQGEFTEGAADNPLAALFAYLRAGAPRSKTRAIQLTHLVEYLSRHPSTPSLIDQSQDVMDGQAAAADAAGTPMFADSSVIDTVTSDDSCVQPCLASSASILALPLRRIALPAVLGQ